MTDMPDIGYVEAYHRHGQYHKFYLSKQHALSGIKKPHNNRLPYKARPAVLRESKKGDL
jgi:hypothetical protein